MEIRDGSESVSLSPPTLFHKIHNKCKLNLILGWDIFVLISHLLIPNSIFISRFHPRGMVQCCDMHKGRLLIAFPVSVGRLFYFSV